MKHATIIQFRNCALGTHPREMETYFPPKTVYCVCSHFTQNDLELKTPQMHNPRGTPIQGMLVFSNEILRHMQKVSTNLHGIMR